MPLFTYKDFTDHLADYLGGTGEKDARDYRRTAKEALREVASLFPWVYYVASARLNVAGPYSTGTIEFDLTGGTHERLVTLTDGTFPAWTAAGVIDIDGLRCEVDRLIDTQHLTLSERSCPPDDVAAGTGFSLSRDSYPAPSDFYKPVTCLYTTGGVEGPVYVEPSRLGDSGFCRSFTIAGDPNTLGGNAFRFDPPPDLTESYEYWYRRSPRELSVESEAAGTVATTSGSNVLTGTGTAFADKHIGAVIRIASNAEAPTGEAGDNPADYERTVIGRAGATSLTVDGVIPETVSGRGYVISDPVDVGTHMLDALKRVAEYRIDSFRNRQDASLSIRMRERELAIKRSMSADNKSMGDRWVGRTPLGKSYADYAGFRTYG